MSEAVAEPTERVRPPATGGLKCHVEGAHVRTTAVDAGGVRFEWLIETVTGAEGEAVKEAQARAVRELGRWLSEQRKQKN